MDRSPLLGTIAKAYAGTLKPDIGRLLGFGLSGAAASFLDSLLRWHQAISDLYLAFFEKAGNVELESPGEA